MADIDRYLQAATRNHIRRSYQSVIRHSGREWGGFPSASADSVACYLAEHTQTFSISTLRQRLVAITRWHVPQGFPDPTRAPHVRKVLKGIQALYPAQERRAEPSQLAQLEQLVVSLDAWIATAPSEGNTHQLQMCTCNKALALIGFWRGLRSDELSRLQIEHITVEPGRGMTIFLPRTKTDRNYAGTTHKAPMLSRLCPVAAYETWLAVSSLTEGPVFRRIDRWSRTATDGLQASSIVPLLRALFHRAGLLQSDHYSSHSLRCGLATWVNSNQWDLKILMEYVDRKDACSAMRYTDTADPFVQHRIEIMLSVTPPPGIVG